MTDERRFEAATVELSDAAEKLRAPAAGGAVRRTAIHSLPVTR